MVGDLLKKGILVRDRGMYATLENTIRVTIGQWSDMDVILNTLIKQYGYK
jgi:histidinol-phosphate/aromatic aminotransferase/cobyric acid decarboxylase-like protein